MKSLRINRVALVGVAWTVAVSGVWGQGDEDRYAPLRAALAEKKKEVVLMAEDVLFLTDEYDRVLQDDETDREEKPALRKALIEEQVRLKQLQAQVVQLRSAIRDLRLIPRGEVITAAALKESHQGLGDLGSRGKAAWDRLVEEREAVLESLKSEYREELAYSVMDYEELHIAERANQILLHAMDLHRPESTDEEFRVSRGLPAIRTAAELGFGIAHRSENPNLQAQTTLIALIGYSQFFWDHHARIRDRLGEERLPTDEARNILGVASGDVLASDAIEESKSNLFYLSDHAKDVFNGRIRTIWGAEGSVAVTWWDHNRAKSFHRACAGISTVEEGEPLVPNEHLFALLDEIDGLIAEKKDAESAIQSIKVKYEEQIAEAGRFGGNAALSSAYFNAQQLAGKSGLVLKRFEAAQKLLDQELAGCADADWTPNAKGIAASARAISETHERCEFAGEVRHELTALLR